MARKNNNGQLLPWLSARLDCKEKRFLQIGNSLLVGENSPFKQLTSGAQILYFCMAMESGGKRDVAFSRSTAAKYGLNKNSFSRALAELERNEFIQYAPDLSTGPFKPAVYRFIYTWKESAPQKRGQY